jgi:DNA invertase Pin-like site-specific DNA recombinase
VLTKSVARLILCQLCRRGRPALRRQSEDKLPSSRLEAARAKAKGVYAGKGRPSSIDEAQVREMKTQGLGATAIAKALGIGRASVYRVLEANSI